MANIRELLNNIKNAILGKDVRKSIHDAIEECYRTASVDHDNANMEVEIARGTFDNLNERLDDHKSKIGFLQEDKRNKSEKIKCTDLDSSSDSNKIKLNNLSDEVQRAMSGNAPVNPVIPDGGLTTEKYADKSITTNKCTVLGTWGVLNFASAAIKIDTYDLTIVIPEGAIDIGGTRYKVPQQTLDIPIERVSAFYLVFDTESLTFKIGGGELFCGNHEGSASEYHILCGIFYNDKSCMFNGARVIVDGRSVEGNRATECNLTFDIPMLCNTVADIDKFIDININEKVIKIPAGSYFLQYGGKIINAVYTEDEIIQMDLSTAYGYIVFDTNTKKIAWIKPTLTTQKHIDIKSTQILLGWYQTRSSFYFLCDRYGINGVRVDDFKLSKTISEYEKTKAYVDGLKVNFDEHLSKLFLQYDDVYNGVEILPGEYEPMVKGFTDTNMASMTNTTYLINNLENRLYFDYPLKRIDNLNYDFYRNGAYTFNIGEEILNYNTSWTISHSGTYPDMIYLVFTHTKSKALSPLKCNHFEYLPNKNWIGAVEGITKGNQAIGFALQRNRLESEDIEGIKKFFKEFSDSGDPVKFMYVLEVPNMQITKNPLKIKILETSTISKTFADIVFISKGIDVRKEINTIKTDIEELKTSGPGKNEFILEEFINYPGISNKFPKFLNHWKNQDKDLTIVMTGDSIGARDMHTTYFTSEEQTKRPPGLVSKNFASAIFDKLTWGNVEYRRYDALINGVGIFTETGEFTTYTSKAEWDDNGDRPIHTRVSNSDNAKLQYKIQAAVKKCNFIYRTELTGSEQIQITISEGNGKVQVYDKATKTWVEANRYNFSMKQTTGMGKGNTTYQKRLKMKVIDTTIDKTVSITKVATGSLCYWGIEFTECDYMVTLINSHRGGHTVEMLSNYIVNDVIEHEPDLIIQQVPIMNMGCAYNESKTPKEQVDRFGNYFFNPSNSNSMYSLTNSLTNCEFIIWLPNIGYYAAGVNDSKSELNKWKTKGQLVDTLSYYKVFTGYINSKASIATVNIGDLYFREAKLYAKRSNKTLSQVLKGTSPTGDSYTNDSLHPNDKGVEVMKKYFLPIFNNEVI